VTREFKIIFGLQLAFLKLQNQPHILIHPYFSAALSLA
jgi:hypothetical protein